MGFKDRIAATARTGMDSAVAQVAAARANAGGTSAPGARVVAPRLAADFVPTLVTEAGFPLTEHNVAATTERVTTMFRVKGVQFIEGMGTPAEVEHFKAVTAQPRTGLGNWPQETLDALVAWNPEVNEYIQDLPDKTRRILLEGRYTSGAFFNTSPDQPLPTMEAWASDSAGTPVAAVGGSGLRDYLEKTGGQRVIGRATRRAFVSLGLTVVVMTLLGVVLVGALSSLGFLWGAMAELTSLAALSVLALSLGAGVYLGVQRGAAAGLCAAVNELQLGRVALGTIANTGPIRAVADKRIPLAEAESVLRSAVGLATRSERPQRGPVGALLFRARRLLYQQVERITLASLRQQTAQLVDLRAVLEHVGSRVDGAVVSTTRIWARTTTTQAVLLVFAIAGGFALLMRITAGQ